jgi:glycosyltransferase involved in cell wall biosynthesis
MIRLAFIVPRYGPEVLGGAETITRCLAEHLPPAEFRVEVLTTCARDLLSWQNVYPPGVSSINGISVRRFPIDPRVGDPRLHRALMVQFTNHSPMTVDDEEAWIDSSAHSPALYAHLAQHGDDYDLLIAGPYPFGLTFYSAALCPERTVLWPHLHDEPFARFVQTRLMLEACRGVLFNCEPERALAERKLNIRNPQSFVVGEGLEELPAEPERFRQKVGLTDPFVLYVGRLDEMKNLLTLFSYFAEYKRRRPGPLKLVLMGDGPLAIPPHPDIWAIGFQDEQSKHDALAAALVVCQPSLLESFSLVLMEAWLTGTPVLVHGDCDVTRYHVLRSDGGLYFTSAAEFAGALDWFLDHPEGCAQMGRLGQAYVRREYNWPAVLDRFREAVALWTGRLDPSRRLAQSDRWAR